MKYFIITLILIVPLYVLVGYLFISRNSVPTASVKQKPIACTSEVVGNLKLLAVNFQSSHLPISGNALDNPCMPTALKNAYQGYQNSKGQSDKIATYLKEYDTALADFLNSN